MNAPVVELRGVSHSYPARGSARRRLDVLRAVDLSVEIGSIVGVLGPSGSGKSTLLRLASGLERPSAGRVEVGGSSMWGSGPRPRPPRRGWVSAVFQDAAGALDPAWTVQRVLEEPFHARHRTVARDERLRRIDDVLAQVGLATLPRHLRPAQLSGGQQQRVALARSYLAEPDLLVADEPTSALDVTNAAAVMHLLRRLADRGTAMLVVSHDRAMLESLADVVLRCADGTLRRA